MSERLVLYQPCTKKAGTARIELNYTCSKDSAAMATARCGHGAAAMSESVSTGKCSPGRVGRPLKRLA